MIHFKGFCSNGLGLKVETLTKTWSSLRRWKVASKEIVSHAIHKPLKYQLPPFVVIIIILLCPTTHSAPAHARTRLILSSHRSTSINNCISHIRWCSCCHLLVAVLCHTTPLPPTMRRRIGDDNDVCKRKQSNHLSMVVCCNYQFLELIHTYPL